MKKLVPTFLKYPLIALYVLGRLVLRGLPAREPRVNLAGVLPPKGSRKIVHGGKVKLLALRERFGDAWKKFNLAYFVSSGLPFAPAIWLRLYRLFGIKVVWNQNGVAYPALYPGRPDLVEKVNALYRPITSSDYVIYQTEFTKKCSDQFVGAYRGPSEILVNPVDTKHFSPRPEPLPVYPFVVIMSGHHFESKERLAASLESMRLLRQKGLEAKLLVIGNTQELPRESWIEVVGKFTQEEAPGLYRRAHVLLHLKSLDPCPTIVLEALASGLPVVGLANGGMPELVDERSGILTPAAEDFEKFHYPAAHEVAEALMKVRDNLPSMSRSARAQSLRFDQEIWLKRHEEIFNQLLQ